MATLKDIRKQARDLIRDNLEELRGAEVQDGQDDSKVQSVFLGTVMSIMPSGKYYTPWANSNVGACPRCKGEGKVVNKKADEAAHKASVAADHVLRKYLMDTYGAFCEGKWPADKQAELEEHVRKANATAPTLECTYCHGMGSREALEDETMNEALEEEASKHGCWIESGEGDPCDMFLSQTVEVTEEVEV